MKTKYIISFIISAILIVYYIYTNRNKYLKLPVRGEEWIKPPENIADPIFVQL